jgi:hypothetical protein
MSAMGTFLKALLEKSGISWFFRGVPVELPAYFLPNFKVVEIQTTLSSGFARQTLNLKRATKAIPGSGN